MVLLTASVFGPMSSEQAFALAKPPSGPARASGSSSAKHSTAFNRKNAATSSKTLAMQSDRTSMAQRPNWRPIDGSSQPHPLFDRARPPASLLSWCRPPTLIRSPALARRAEGAAMRGGRVRRYLWRSHISGRWRRPITLILHTRSMGMLQVLLTGFKRRV